MSQKVLVAYATRVGSTKEVADAIGEELRSVGADVDVLPTREVRNMEGYDAVVVGSAIRAGNWLPEAEEFVSSYRASLSRVPVAYFVVCATLSNDTPENRQTVRAYLDPVLRATPEVEPVDIGLFAGALDVKKLSFPLRLKMRSKKMPEGDFRDWHAIRRWARQVRPALLPT